MIYLNLFLTRIIHQHVSASSAVVCRWSDYVLQKRKELCFPAEYTVMQATAHSTKLRSSLRFLELCYAYHYRYANSYLVVGDLNKESKYKSDKKKCKNKQNTRHTHLLTSSTASNITQLIFPVNQCFHALMF